MKKEKMFKIYLIMTSVHQLEKKSINQINNLILEISVDSIERL